MSRRSARMWSNVVTLSSLTFFGGLQRAPFTFVVTSSACVTHLVCASVVQRLSGDHLPHPMPSRHTGPLMNTVYINVSVWSVPLACIAPHTDTLPYTRTLSYACAFGSLGNRFSSAIQPNTPECTCADDERGTRWRDSMRRSGRKRRRRRERNFGRLYNCSYHSPPLPFTPSTHSRYSI
jgi:hypothetical protein